MSAAMFVRCAQALIHSYFSDEMFCFIFVDNEIFRAFIVWDYTMALSTTCQVNVHVIFVFRHGKHLMY